MDSLECAIGCATKASSGFNGDIGEGQQHCIALLLLLTTTNNNIRSFR
jgi:hypothetical protein